MPKYNTRGRFDYLGSDCVRTYATVANVIESNSAPEAMMDKQEAQEAATSLLEARSVPMVAAIATGVGCATPSYVVPPAVIEALPDFCGNPGHCYQLEFTFSRGAVSCG